MSHESINEGPIFVVGMNGSGTTMLVNCLNQHPLIFGFPYETKFIPSFIEKSRVTGDMDDDNNYLKWWREFKSNERFRVANGGEDVPISENWRDLPRDIATIIDQTFLYFAKKDGKSRWCEKTPRYALHMPLLGSTLSNAKFVHIYRDGRDCAASFHRRWRFRPERTIYRWKNVVAKARKDGSALGSRYHEICYEDLTANPEKVLMSVCSFLAIPFDRNMLVYKKRGISTEGASSEWDPISENIIPNSGKWRDYFSGDQARRLERIAGKALNQLGYKTDAPEEDADPPQWLLAWWKYLDLIKQSLDHVMGSKRKYSLRERVMASVRLEG